MQMIGGQARSAELEIFPSASRFKIYKSLEEKKKKILKESESFQCACGRQFTAGQETCPPAIELWSHNSPEDF